MTKLGYVLKESFYLVKKHKVYFLAPILIILALLGLVAYYIGPSAIISFIYAGI
jgi:hypothetical protein